MDSYGLDRNNYQEDYSIHQYFNQEIKQLENREITIHLKGKAENIRLYYIEY